MAMYLALMVIDVPVTQVVLDAGGEDLHVRPRLRKKTGHVAALGLRSSGYAFVVPGDHQGDLHSPSSPPASPARSAITLPIPAVTRAVLS